MPESQGPTTFPVAIRKSPAISRVRPEGGFAGRLVGGSCGSCCFDAEGFDHHAEGSITMQNVFDPLLIWRCPSERSARPCALIRYLVISTPSASAACHPQNLPTLANW